MEPMNTIIIKCGFFVNMGNTLMRTRAKTNITGMRRILNEYDWFKNKRNAVLFSFNLATVRVADNENPYSINRRQKMPNVCARATSPREDGPNFRAINGNIKKDKM